MIVNLTYFYLVFGRPPSVMRSVRLRRPPQLVNMFQTLSGSGPHEGVSLLRSPLPSVFRCCARLLEATFEAYASPFTCYFRQYCGPFPDTDGYFGSRGRFTDFRPIEGSFVLASPPFCEEMAEVGHSVRSHVYGVVAGECGAPFVVAVGVGQRCVVVRAAARERTVDTRPGAVTVRASDASGARVGLLSCDSLRHSLTLRPLLASRSAAVCGIVSVHVSRISTVL